MKIHSSIWLGLACILTLAHSAPVEKNIALDCNGKQTIQVGLCADINFGGYCHDFTTCPTSCYDLVDYGMMDSFGKGVSSFVMPKGQFCQFFAGRECDVSSDNAGSYESQPDMDIFRNGVFTEDVHFNDKTVSFRCAHGSLSKRNVSTAAASVTDNSVTGNDNEDSFRIELSKNKISSAADSVTDNSVTDDDDDSSPIELIKREVSTAVALSNDSKRNPSAPIKVSLCRRINHIDCRNYNFEVGSCYDISHNPSLVGFASAILDSDTQCVLYDDHDCKGENIIISISEPNLNLMPNENVIANFNYKMASMWCCSHRGHPGVGKCNGSCICDKKGVWVEEGA
jgi:hypothetical protein